ncbi:bactofilin family protein [Pedobacter sp. MW01-1-1]|uniref:bactofilin family protein n=1 Tax=Pedobacter sp. MW01-1-1 TaxID=3383027 RepID=UPI003FF0B1AA
MFKKNKQTQPLAINQQEITTVIGEDIVIDGTIKGQLVIRIDGTVNGDVLVEAGVVLGEKGVVNGNVDTKSAIIYGSVKGNVKANQLEIKQSGKVEGDIKTEILEIELGAQYNGKLEMKQFISKEEVSAAL